MLIEFRYRFEAAHRFLNSQSVPCMTPHGHTWHATLGLKFTGAGLDKTQMAVEFSQLKKEWKTLIQENLDHSYFHNINDPIVEVLQASHQKARLIPFPGDPTTELISVFLFHKMDLIVKQSSFKDKVQVNFIKVEETPTNSIHCDQEFYLSAIEPYKNQKGWWTDIDPLSRKYESL